MLDVVYNSLNQVVFETRWGKFVKEYCLEGNDYLYVECHMWVPSFMTDHFWAGMRSTQRVESIHSFFDQFVTRDTLLCEFGERYTVAVDRRISQEKEADEKSGKWSYICTTGYSVEAFFSKLYTNKKFREVQPECVRVTHLNYQCHLNLTIVLSGFFLKKVLFFVVQIIINIIFNYPTFAIIQILKLIIT